MLTPGLRVRGHAWEWVVLFVQRHRSKLFTLLAALACGVVGWMIGGE
jgi:hypothetical protein